MADAAALRDKRRHLAILGRQLLTCIKDIDSTLAELDAHDADHDQSIASNQQGDVSVETSTQSGSAREEATGGGDTDGPRKRRAIALGQSSAAPTVPPEASPRGDPTRPVQHSTAATNTTRNTAASNIGTAAQGGGRPETLQERILRLNRAVPKGELVVKDDPAYWTVVRSEDRLAELHCPDSTCNANARKTYGPNEIGGTFPVTEFFKGPAGLRMHVVAKHNYQHWKGLSYAAIAQRAHKSFLSDEQADAVYNGRHDLYQVEKCLPHDHDGDDTDEDDHEDHPDEDD